MYASVCVLSVQLYLTLCDPKDCSPPGLSVHGILQQWAAISYANMCDYKCINIYPFLGSFKKISISSFGSSSRHVET